MSFHTRIKNRRIALFPSQEAFAHELEMSYGIKVKWQSVQQWEKDGGTAPNRSRMPAVAAALNTTPEWLLYGTGDEVVVSQPGPSRLRAVSASTPSPKWMNPEAYKLLDLYYSLDSEDRAEVMNTAVELHRGKSSGSGAANK